MGRRSRAGRPAPDPGPAGPTRLAALQSAATTLSAGAEGRPALEELLDRAAGALPGAAVLLATTSADGDGVAAYASGVPAETVDALAAVLMAGSAPAPGSVAVDVVAGRRWHGRLAALPESGPLPPDTRAVLESYAGLLAAVCERRAAVAEAAAESARADALLALGAALAEATDPDAAGIAASSVLPVVLGCSRATVLLWEAGEGRLRTATTGSVPAGRSPAGTAPNAVPAGLEAGETPELVGMLTDRAPRLLRWEASSPALRAVLAEAGSTDALAVPLVSDGTFLGVVLASWPAGQSPARPEGEHLDRLRGVAGPLALALGSLRLAQTVRHQATHDALTGLPNRGLLHERLERALAAVRPEQHVGLVCCAIADLAAVDREHGATGDDVLRQLAARLRAAVRPGDTVGRLAGTEFALVLAALGSPADVDAVVARVRACFAEPFRAGRRPVQVAPTIGVEVFSGERGPGDRRSADELLTAARAARRAEA